MRKSFNRRESANQGNQWRSSVLKGVSEVRGTRLSGSETLAYQGVGQYEDCDGERGVMV